MVKYKCLDCGEEFENKIAAVIHAVATKHQNYDLVGTDVKLTVKA